MQKIGEVYFFGGSYRIAQVLDGIGCVKQIFCEKRTFNTDIYDYARLYSIKFTIVENGDDMSLALPAKTTGAVGVSYGFGIIFRRSHISRFAYGIWNIHTGELPGNRGRHPIAWSFLNGQKRFGLAIHEINEEIDKGYLLACTHVMRDLKDGQSEIEQKMCTALESGLIVTAMENYFSGKKAELAEGTYHESMVDKFVEINPEDYDAVFLFNLFKCQAKYGGVKVKGKKYNDCKFYNPDYPELYNGYDLFESKGEEMVALRRGNSPE